MTESLRQQILAKVIEEVNAITVADGFQNDVPNVNGEGWARRSHFADVELPLPRCLVEVANDRKEEEGYNDRLKSNLLVAVSVMVASDEDPDVERRLDSYLTDIETAVNRDPKHGDLATDTVTEEIEFVEGEDFPDMMWGYVLFRIAYRQRRTDPTRKPGRSTT